MMFRQSSPAAVISRGDPAKGKRLLRLAWISVALILVTFVAAMLIGEGLISLQGYESGADQLPPLGVTLLAAIPAGLVMSTPAVAAVVFGFRRALTAPPPASFRRSSASSSSCTGDSRKFLPRILGM